MAGTSPGVAPQGSGSEGATPAPAVGPAAPQVSLPKGGGAIRGIGEKFAANPVTGTGTLTVPIATSPGRSGFGPQLSLAYNSGSGNGPFGLGWSLGGLPSITRRTDKGLPRYQDRDESDIFILSGAEDLVPVLVEDAGGIGVARQPRRRTAIRSRGTGRGSRDYSRESSAGHARATETLTGAPFPRTTSPHFMARRARVALPIPPMRARFSPG